MRINASESITTGKMVCGRFISFSSSASPFFFPFAWDKNNAECAGSKAEYLSAATNKSAAFQTPCFNVGVNKSRLLDGIE